MDANCSPSTSRRITDLNADGDLLVLLAVRGLGALVVRAVGEYDTGRMQLEGCYLALREEIGHVDGI